MLTGKYTKGGDIDTKRSEGNQRRLTDRNLAIAKEVDRIAAELGATSAQVATAWVRQQAPGIVPIVGARKVSQIQDVIGSAAVELSTAHLGTLEELSRIELGFPHDFLATPIVRGLVYGDTDERTDLPAGVPGRDRGTG